MVTTSMAPELLNKERVTSKVDVYSFGCIIDEVLSEKSCWYRAGITDVKDVRARRGDDV